MYVCILGVSSPAGQNEKFCERTWSHDSHNKGGFP
jgi:hypothetical protein